MASKIKGTVTSTVTLGTSGYSSPLTIWEFGAIAPTVGGATALVVPKEHAHGVVINDGAIVGALGLYGTGEGAGSTGGIGIDIEGFAKITNKGHISAGNGGLSATNVGYSGGDGIIFQAGGKLANSGTITGGNGNQKADSGTVSGGIGVDVTSHANIVNDGVVDGGLGGEVHDGGYYVGGNGGAGIVFTNGGNLTNDGTIVGGTAGSSYYILGYGAGGAGVSAGGGAHVTNDGVIVGGGGVGPGIGVYLGAGGVLQNSGNIDAGTAFTNSYDTNAGVQLGVGAEIINSGTIRGSEGNWGYYEGAGGGAGINAAGGVTIMNTGLIDGGGGGYGRNDGGPPGGAGIDLAHGGLLNNAGGVIVGGGAGNSYYGNGPVGSTGVILGNGGTFLNTGTVAAGSGGPSSEYYGGVGAPGGTGVVIYGGAVVTNGGVILGGNGGYSNGAGGSGVYLNGGTLINSGTISGGEGGTYGDAVQFGSVAGTLVVDSGAVFVDNVVANSKVDDVLQLAGSTPGTLRALGTHFIGFTTVTEDAGATWTLSLPASLGTGSSLFDAGIMAIQHGLADEGGATITGQGLLETTETASIQIDTLTLAGGTLMCSATGTVMIGASDSGGAAGTITVENGATITGAGVIDSTALVTDDGSVVASGGTLTIQPSLGGSGTLQIDSGAALVEAATLSVANVIFGSGGDAYLAVGAAIPTAPPEPLFSGFGNGDIIDLENVQATTLSFSKGTLTLENGHTVVDTLLFAGDYTSGNFTLSSDHHGGTDINYVANGGGAMLPDFAFGVDGDSAARATGVQDDWGGSIAGRFVPVLSILAEPFSEMLHHGLI